jgi:hypothetical protein
MERIAQLAVRPLHDGSGRDRAARDTSSLHPLPQLEGESVNAFCFPPASGKACHGAGPAEADLRRGRPSST